VRQYYNKKMKNYSNQEYLLSLPSIGEKSTEQDWKKNIEIGANASSILSNISTNTDQSLINDDSRKGKGQAPISSMPPIGECVDNGAKFNLNKLSSFNYSPFSFPSLHSTTVMKSDKNKHPVSHLGKILNKYYPLNYQYDSNLTDKEKNLYKRVTFNKKTYNHLRKLRDFIYANKKEILRIRDKIKFSSHRLSSDLSVQPSLHSPIGGKVIIDSNTSFYKLEYGQVLNGTNISHTHSNFSPIEAVVLNNKLFNTNFNILASPSSISSLRDPSLHSSIGGKVISDRSTPSFASTPIGEKMLGNKISGDNQDIKLFKLLNNRLNKYIFKYRYNYLYKHINNKHVNNISINNANLRNRGLNKHNLIHGYLFKNLYKYLNNELNKFIALTPSQPLHAHVRQCWPLRQSDPLIDYCRTSRQASKMRTINASLTPIIPSLTQSLSNYNYFSKSYYNHSLIRNMIKSNFIINSWFKTIYDTIPSKFKESNITLLPYT
jgi:hypothetical protein